MPEARVGASDLDGIPLGADRKPSASHIEPAEHYGQRIRYFMERSSELAMNAAREVLRLDQRGARALHDRNLRLESANGLAVSVTFQSSQTLPSRVQACWNQERECPVFVGARLGDLNDGLRRCDRVFPLQGNVRIHAEERARNGGLRALVPDHDPAPIDHRQGNAKVERSPIRGDLGRGAYVPGEVRARLRLHGEVVRAFFGADLEPPGLAHDTPRGERNFRRGTELRLQDV